MAIDTQDLLYTHGCLCAYARSDDSEFDNITDAARLCSVLNKLQEELKERLVPDAKPFEIVSTDLKLRDETIVVHKVQPVGGW